jgi:hypothetical protein
VPAPDKTAAPKEAAFHDAMRKLWEEHITWTRVFIISAAADLPDKDAATQRLLQNQVDIGNAVKPFYGAAAGDVKAYDAVHQQILHMADMLSDGIVGQFPKQFK